jgi:hypothetical protein
MISSSTTSANRLSPSSIVVTDRAIHAIIDKRNVEYIEWRTKSKQHSNTNNNNGGVPVVTTTTPIQIVVEGANAIHDQNPIMTKLYTQLLQVLESLQKENQLRSGKVLLLDYDTTSTITLYDRGMFQLCDSTIVVDAAVTDDASTASTTRTTENDETDVIVSSSTSTYHHNCKFLRRFQI